MRTQWNSRNRRPRWLVAAAAVAVLPVTALTSSVAPTAVAADMHHPSSRWSTWMGSAILTPSTTLKDVRTIIGASTGTAATLTGAGVGIALIDTGVAPVPGLPAAQIVNGPDLSFESQSSTMRYLDAYGHGTHMAGIIVGDDVLTGTKGLAPKAKLTSIKVGTSNGAVDVSQVLAAVDWVVKHRNDDPANPIRVINLSYGSGGNPNTLLDPLQFAVEQAWKAGIVVVAASGNGGLSKLSNPASDPFVLSVGASGTRGTLSVADDVASVFTNGLSSDNLELLAPGESIVSLRDPGGFIDTMFPFAQVGTTLFRGSGTSQAAAVTSAAVALLLQNRPSLSPDQVKELLIKNGTSIGGSGGLSWWGSSSVKQLNVGRAIAASTPYAKQWNWPAWGKGQLEDARGTSHVVQDGKILSGENTIFGPFSSSTWAQQSSRQTSWNGGLWMGKRFAGDGWTGTSWASKTWASAAWQGTAWTGSSWTDPAWTGRYWSGRYWSGVGWSGRYWSSDDWSSAHWG